MEIDASIKESVTRQDTSTVEQVVQEQESNIRPITIRTMLESGAHYGHRSSVWNPKMAPYIFGLKDNIYIIDLQLTLKKWHLAQNAIFDCISNGGTILFAGRRKKSIPIIEREAQRCGAFYMTGRWPGGTVTNFHTVRRSVKKMLEMEKFVAAASTEDGPDITKKELLDTTRELEKLQNQFNGIRNMTQPPSMLFVTHNILDKLSIAEARVSHIPVVGLADTNANPDLYDHIIPVNDDALMSLDLFITNVAETVLQARISYESRMEAIAQENDQAAEDFIEDELA